MPVSMALGEFQDGRRPARQEIEQRVRRALAITAGILAAAAVASGAVWAGLARSSGRPTPATTAVTSPIAVRSPVFATTSSAGAAPSSPVALASTASPSPTPAVAVCDAANLQMSNPQSLESGMGGLTVAIVFRNVGSQPCSLTGWPTIATPSLRTKVQYTTFTGAGFVVPVTRVVLQPGGAGSAALDLFGHPGSTYSQECFEVGSWAVTLPGSRKPTPVPWPSYQGACPGGTILVSPFYSGDAVEIGFGSADPSSIPLLGPFDSPPTVP
jgi:Protein of unknown function (DUF4232)